MSAKYPDPQKMGLPERQMLHHLRQFQRDTVLACAEEVGHDHAEVWETIGGSPKRFIDCPTCKLLARAERMR